MEWVVERGKPVVGQAEMNETDSFLAQLCQVCHKITGQVERLRCRIIQASKKHTKNALNNK